MVIDSINVYTGASACSSDSNPQEIIGLTGTLQSPNYPGYYFNDATCQWLITSVYFNGVTYLFSDTLQPCFSSTAHRTAIVCFDTVYTLLLAYNNTNAYIDFREM